MYISEVSPPPGTTSLNDVGYQTNLFTGLTGTFEASQVDSYGMVYQDLYLTDCYLTSVNVTFADDYYDGPVSLFLTGNRKDLTVSLENFANANGMSGYLDLSGSNVVSLTFGDYDFNSTAGAEIDISDNRLSEFPAGFWSGVEALASNSYSYVGSVDASGSQMPEPDEYDWDAIGFAQYMGCTISVNGSNATLTVSGATGDGATANGTYHWDGMFWNHDAPNNNWVIGYTGGQWSLTDFNVDYSSYYLFGSDWDGGDVHLGNPTTTLS